MLFDKEKLLPRQIIHLGEGICSIQTLRRRFMSDLTVTDLAVAKLKEYMQANNIDSSLRVALMQGG